MAKYPVSVSSGKLGEFFQKVLDLHVPIGSTILDPTCGGMKLWEGVDPGIRRVFLSDINPVCAPNPSTLSGQGAFKVVDLTKPESATAYGPEMFDAVIFDPPYFFGAKSVTDPREQAYGGYTQTLDDLVNLVGSSLEHFAKWVKPNGKLIFKCSDQYHVKERKFYPLHVAWTDGADMFGFSLIDVMIYVYHRVSPTAYQVKDRPCSVISHTYFLVFQK